MRRFDVGDEVRVARTQKYKNHPQDHLTVGMVGEITRVADEETFSNYAEALIHVEFRDHATMQTSWIQVDCLEPLIDEGDVQRTLESIRQAGEGALGNELQFDEIVFRDESGNRYKLQPHGENKVLLTDEKATFEMVLDRRTWKNLSGLAELALNAPGQ